MPAPSTFHQHAREQLGLREHELRLQLAAGSLIGADESGEVHDFKDVAAEDTRLALDDITAAHAMRELAEVVAALARLAAGTYGLCHDCGEPIDERRLAAMPATPCCADCQRVREATAALAS
jgi:DnaK suppressor protein